MNGLFTAPTVAAASGGHDGFGALRLGLALAVLVSHAFSIPTGDVGAEPLKASTGFTLGEHAVNGFFAISGFLVAMSYDRRGAAAYVLARALRILPAFVTAVLLVALVLAPLWSTRGAAAYFADPATWSFVSRTLTGFKSTATLPGFLEDNPLRFPLGTVWTLKYEVLCYAGVLAAGLAGLFRRRDIALMLVAALVIALVAADVLRPDLPKGQQTALRLPLIFAAGSLAYLWRDRLRLSPLAAAAGLAATALLAATPAYHAALYLSSAYAVLTLALHPALARLLPEPAQDYSYGAYIYGFAVQQMLHASLPQLGPLAALLLAVPITLLLAALSWHLVEKPALGLKERVMPAARKARPGGAAGHA